MKAYVRFMKNDKSRKFLEVRLTDFFKQAWYDDGCYTHESRIIRSIDVSASHAYIYKVERIGLKHCPGGLHLDASNWSQLLRQACTPLSYLELVDIIRHCNILPLDTPESSSYLSVTRTLADTKKHLQPSNYNFGLRIEQAQILRMQQQLSRDFSAVPEPSQSVIARAADTKGDTKASAPPTTVSRSAQILPDESIPLLELPPPAQPSTTVAALVNNSSVLQAPQALPPAVQPSTTVGALINNSSVLQAPQALPPAGQPVAQQLIQQPAQAQPNPQTASSSTGQGNQSCCNIL
jgi:hypothetical protein